MKTDSGNELDYDLIMAFIDETKSFVHGFECGRLWEWMTEGKDFDNYLIHSKNNKQVKKMLKIYEYDYRIEKIDNVFSTIFGTNKAKFN